MAVFKDSISSSSPLTISTPLACSACDLALAGSRVIPRSAYLAESSGWARYVSKIEPPWLPVDPKIVRIRLAVIVIDRICQFEARIKRLYFLHNSLGDDDDAADDKRRPDEAFMRLLYAMSDPWLAATNRTFALLHCTRYDIA
jgi:hypothetical protein